MMYAIRAITFHPMTAFAYTEGEALAIGAEISSQWNCEVQITIGPMRDGYLYQILRGGKVIDVQVEDHAPLPKL